MQQVMNGLGQCLAALGLGLFLRQSICNETDGETAAKFALWITLPSLILQSFNGVPLADLPLQVVPLYSLSLCISAGVAWLRTRGLHPKERGLLAGVSVGSSVSLAALPLAAALFPLQGLRAALLCVAANLLASHLASLMLFSTAGPAFPDSFEHLDGGKYRGEWKGMLKDGYGVYTYPSGARYEGQWREGAKDGRGVYYFPKGGLYEGEWRGGVMAGVGVRTFASGKVQAGVWAAGKLETAVDESLCALAVEGANEAATVAQRVEVGGASWGVALQQVAAQPAAWAFVAAAGMAAAGAELTPTVDAATKALAAAHGPLALLAVGLTLERNPIPTKQMQEIAASLATRLLPPLLALLAAAAAAHLLAWPAGRVLMLLGPLAVCAVAPVSPAALHHAHTFRLNESIAVGLTQAAATVSWLLMPFLGVTAVASALVDSLLPFMVALAGAASGVTATAAAVALEGQRLPGSRRSGNESGGRVKMVYTGPPQPPQQGGDGRNSVDPAVSRPQQPGREEGGGAPPPPFPAAAAIPGGRMGGYTTAPGLLKAVLFSPRRRSPPLPLLGGRGCLAPAVSAPRIPRCFFAL